MEDYQRLEADVARLRRRVEDLSGGGGSGSEPPALGSQFPVPTPLPVTVPPSAVSQIRNGEWGHSVDTWFNPPPGAALSDDIALEAAYWFSNVAPFNGQLLSFIDARTSSVNDALKSFLHHSTYDVSRCDWDRATGEARFQGTASLDAPFPNNRMVTPNRAVEFLGALIARRNSTIVIPFDCHLYCGLWDNSAAKLNWIAGTPFTLNYSVRGTPSSTTERRYKVYAFTDRGYTYLSSEAFVINAPGDFNEADVYLSWKAIPGILQYWVYRFDVVDNQYQLLKKIGSGNPNYADNGNVKEHDVGGYPAATNTVPIAYVATREHELDSVAVDGEPWTSLALAPPIPSDYDSSATDGEQVLRVGLTKALDRQMVDAVSVSGSVVIESATGEFSSLDNGRDATLFDAEGNILHGPESITFIDATHVAFGTSVSTNNSGATLYIVGGGDHGLLIDALHISYVAGAAFAAYPDDLNRLDFGGQNPVAAPNHSSQGGAGGGGEIGPGGGGVGCITWDCPVNVWVGNSLESWSWAALRIGEYIFSGDLRASRIIAKPSSETDELHLLRVRASWLFDIEVPCSPRQPVITERLDTTGRAVKHLQPDDHALIGIDGKVSRQRIREIVNTRQPAETGIFTLTPGHVFFAGRPRYRTFIHRSIAWILRKLGYRLPVVGVALHNAKPLE